MRSRVQTAALLGAAAALLIAPVAHAATAPSDDPLDQNVTSDERLGDERVVVDHGHLDIGPRFVDGEWTTLVRDDSVAPPVWRRPEDVVVRLTDAARLPAPEDEEFDFIDAEPGDELYVIPQTQLTDVAWVGWNTQDPEVVSSLARGMTLRFHGASGPGTFTLFLQNGNFDPPSLLWDGRDPEPQDIWAEANTHVHANWVFTEPGVYAIDVELIAELADGQAVSDRDVLRLAVGSATDARQAFDAAPGGPSAPPPEEGGAAAREDPVAEDDVGARDGGGIGPTIALGAGLVVIAGAAIAVLRSRRVRRLAAQSPGPDGEARS